ncbi:MAG: flap endonuclease-1 [Candidatus Diapherotrites archaeon CG11_big_fil_rev_8_21_14_0_20_37_9]|nr:MAG: flap endonuclease-1 [Candidatus Diapherotrites archaeon CG11_big_fil_rev_8_21_14_0_20_37_9]
MGTAIGDIVPREKISLDSLNGMIIGIDSYNMIYQFLSSIRGMDGTPLMDSHGNVTSHITGLFYRTLNLVERGARPVFVFDGTPSILKSETLKARKAIRTDAIEKHEKALKEGNIAEAKKFGSRALKLDQKMIDSAKELVSLMGFPVVQAPSEGEAQVVSMLNEGKVDGCVSQDYDALLFGAKILYRNIGVSGKRKIPGKNIYADVEPEKILLERVLKENNLTREKLIWIGILIGTDFNEKFPKIGIKTALKLVTKNNSFEDIITSTEHEPDFDWKEIFDLFMKPNVTTEYSVKMSLPDEEKLKEFLCDKHDFSRDRVENGIKKLVQKLSDKSKQSTLGAWQ